MFIYLLQKQPDIRRGLTSGTTSITLFCIEENSTAPFNLCFLSVID